MSMDELWQAYDEQGNPLTARGLPKQEAAEGVLHGTAHVWLWRKRGGTIEFLLQKRAKIARTWPGFLDVSAAGHCEFLETPLQAAVRETKEELGLDVAPTELRLLAVHRQWFQDKGSGIIENEFQWIYGLSHEADLVLSGHDGEAEAVVWLSLADFQKLISGKTHDKIIPHGDAYFATLLKEVQR